MYGLPRVSTDGFARPLRIFFGFEELSHYLGIMFWGCEEFGHYFGRVREGLRDLPGGLCDSPGCCGGGGLTLKQWTSSQVVYSWIPFGYHPLELEQYRED